MKPRTPKVSFLALILTTFLFGLSNVQANNQFQLKSKYGKGCPVEGWFRSTASNAPATVGFNNATKSPLQLYWLDFQGKAQFHSNIQPSQWLRVNTFQTHMWFAKDPQKGDCVGGVVNVNAKTMMSAFSRQKASAPSKKPFKFPARPKAPQNTLSAQQQALKKAFQAHLQKNGAKKAAQKKQANSNKYQCPFEGWTKSPSSKFSSNLTFKNNTWAPVTIYWLNYQGKSQKFMDIQAGKSASISSYVGHYWYAKDAQGKCYGKAMKVTTANQTFNIRY